MSSPLVWILLPAMTGVLLSFLRRWSWLVNLLGIITSLLLALVAWRVPIGQPIMLGPWRWLPLIEISDSLSFLGRRFFLDDPIRPALAFIYLGAAIWFIGATAARAPRLFTPIGLIIAALFTAALAVEPFLYAALLIEVAALLSIPILAPPGQPVSSGVLRFLTIQTLGMPIILLAGWMTGMVEANPAEASLAVRAAVLLGLGFAMLMAVFPFHSWIPMLAEETHPYTTAFIFFTILVFATLFGFSMVIRFTWLQNLPAVASSLRLVGVLIIAAAGIWAAFQRNLGRIMGYAVTLNIGLTLLALSLAIDTVEPVNVISATGNAGQEVNRLLLGTFFTQVLPTGLTMALWALALSIIKSLVSSLKFRQVQGLARRAPFAVAGLGAANLSLAGLPLLAGFPIRAALGIELARISPLLTALVLLGYAGLIAAAIRSLAVLVMAPEEQTWGSVESWMQIVLLVTGCLALLLVGIFPQVFLPNPGLMGSIFGSGK